MTLSKGEVEAAESPKIHFEFEVSPHTLRLHPFENKHPLAMSLRLDAINAMDGHCSGSSEQRFRQSLYQQLYQQALDFQAAWNRLTPLQQKMARGRSYKAEAGSKVAHANLYPPHASDCPALYLRKFLMYPTTLPARQCGQELRVEHFKLTPSLTGSTSRFLRKSDSADSEDREGPPEMEKELLGDVDGLMGPCSNCIVCSFCQESEGLFCNVQVRYQGRLSGRSVQFLQPVALVPAMPASDANPASEHGELIQPFMLCLECRKPLRPVPQQSQQFSFEGQRRISVGEVSESSLFCSGGCRGRYFGKRNGTALRRQLFALERGVCQTCGLDCHGLYQQLRNSKAWLKELGALAAKAEAEAQNAHGLVHLVHLVHGARSERGERSNERSPELALFEHLSGQARSSSVRGPRAVLHKTLREGVLWQADHVVPVWQGGGACGLENLQTLCARCHSLKTGKEAIRRRALKTRFVLKAPRTRKALEGFWPAGRLRNMRSFQSLQPSPGSQRIEL